MANVNTIFEGVTRSPAREFIAETVKQGNFKTIFAPAAGRFGTCLTMLKTGVAKPEQLRTSDILLFTSIIGYLADPTKTLDMLQIRVIGDEEERLVKDAKDELDFAAGVMLAFKLNQLPPTNGYNLSVRREIMRGMADYRTNVRDSLIEVVDALRGMNYEIADARDVFKQAVGEKDAFMTVDLPTVAGGYSKMFTDRSMKWLAPTVAMIDPPESRALLEGLTHGECAVLAHRRDEAMFPAGWDVAFASEQGNEVEFLVSNVAMGRRMAATTYVPKGKAKIYPIFCDEEITADSKVQFVPADKPTALYYRDLFVHRPGTTAAEDYYLLLIDGRVVTSFGLWHSDITGMRSEDVGEVFGTMRSSPRYARLDKLAKLLLTSGDFKRVLIRDNKMFHLREPMGMRTTVLTKHGAEPMTYRGVMKVVHREKVDNDNWKIVCRCDFRQDTFQDVLKFWLERWGTQARKTQPVTDAQAA